MSSTDGQIPVTNKDAQVGADCLAASQTFQQSQRCGSGLTQPPAPSKATPDTTFRCRYPEILARSVSYALSGIFGIGSMKGCRGVRWTLSHLCPAPASHLIHSKLIFKTSLMLWIGAMAGLLPAPQLTLPENSSRVTE